MIDIWKLFPLLDIGNDTEDGILLAAPGLFTIYKLTPLNRHRFDAAGIMHELGAGIRQVHASFVDSEDLTVQFVSEVSDQATDPLLHDWMNRMRPEGEIQRELIASRARMLKGSMDGRAWLAVLTEKRPGDDQEFTLFIDRHRTYCKHVESVLPSNGIGLLRLSSEESVNALDGLINPRSRPRGSSAHSSMESMAPIALGERLFAGPVDERGGRLEVDGVYYRSFRVLQPPKRHEFREGVVNLLEDLTGFPLRISLSIGRRDRQTQSKLSSIRFKSSLFALSNRNGQIYRAAKKAAADDNLQWWLGSCRFVTWGATADAADKNAEVLARQLSAAGFGVVDERFHQAGGWVSTIPGMGWPSPGDMVLRSTDLFMMLPWFASWGGFRPFTLPLLVPSGQLWGFEMFHRSQESATTMIIAPPAKGKSTLIQLIIQSTWMASEEKPLILLVDFTDASFSAINALRETIPESSRWKDAFGTYRIDLSDEFAMNPFDLLPCCWEPVSSEKLWLVGFIMGLMGIAEDPWKEGVLSRAITRLYEEFAPGGRRERRFERGAEPEVDALLDNVRLDTWWMCFHFLLDRLDDPASMQMSGEDSNAYRRAALRAFYRAMPTLKDLVFVMTDVDVLQFYTAEEDRVKELARNIGDILEQPYGCLFKCTTLDIEKRVVAVNLEPIYSEDRPKPAAVVFGLLHRRFSRLAEMTWKGLPEPAKRWFDEATVMGIERAVKPIFCDESHRLSALPELFRRTVATIRMQRKNRVAVVMATHQTSDIPDRIRALFDTRILLQAGAEAQKNYADDLHLPRGVRAAYDRLRLVPGQYSDALVLTRTGDGEQPSVVRVALTPQEAWMTSTTSEIKSFRDAVHRRLGDVVGLRFLSENYPVSSVGKLIESLGYDAALERVAKEGEAYRHKYASA